MHVKNSAVLRHGLYLQICDRVERGAKSDRKSVDHNFGKGAPIPLSAVQDEAAIVVHNHNSAQHEHSTEHLRRHGGYSNGGDLLGQLSAVLRGAKE